MPRLGNPDIIRAIAAEKRTWTHCSRGHEFVPENTYWKKSNGTRECRTCMYARDSLRKKRARVEARAKRRPRSDGILDEVALARARAGDELAYRRLTKEEHRTLVLQLLDVEELPPFPQLRNAVSAERRRRAQRCPGT